MLVSPLEQKLTSEMKVKVKSSVSVYVCMKLILMLRVKRELTYLEEGEYFVCLV